MNSKKENKEVHSCREIGNKFSNKVINVKAGQIANNQNVMLQSCVLIMMPASNFIYLTLKKIVVPKVKGIIQ